MAWTYILEFDDLGVYGTGNYNMYLSSEDVYDVYEQDPYYTVQCIEDSYMSADRDERDFLGERVQRRWF